MKTEDWNLPEIKPYFKPSEFNPHPGMMDLNYMRLLSTVRHLCKKPFQIHCGYELDGHAKNSYHGIGHASDKHMLDIDPYDALDLEWAVLDDMGIIDKVGFGFYPHWATPGTHLDDRGWQCGDRPPAPGVHWVRLDRPFGGFKAGYYYNEIADKIIKLLKKYR